MTEPTPAHEPPAPPPEGPIAPGTGRQVWGRREATDAEARALASGLRLRILRLVLHEPMTNKEIAERLGRNPASILHHVRTLVATGFLVPQEGRTGPRGAREVPYLASGKSFYLHDAGRPPAMMQAFLAEVAAVPEDALSISRLGVRVSAAELAELRSRIQDLLDDFAARPPDVDGERWSLFVALHPEP